MTQPSPGALRAAKAINEKLCILPGFYKDFDHRMIKPIAEIIDRETGASDLSETVSRELLAVLEKLAVDAAVINNRQPIGEAPDSRTAEHWSSFRESINNAYTAIAIAKAKRSEA